MDFMRSEAAKVPGGVLIRACVDWITYGTTYLIHEVIRGLGHNGTLWDHRRPQMTVGKFDTMIKGNFWDVKQAKAIRREIAKGIIARI